ncbi:MAG: insulinase family protein [Myxococcota bacterium]
MRRVLPLSLCVAALIAPSDALAYARTTEWTLPSGLVVLHRPDARFPVVRVLVTVGAGTADTAPGQRPLAHLAEHVAFRAELDGNPAFQALRGAGCGVNGETRLDTTAYVLECPTDAAALAVGFAAAIATHDFRGIEEDDVRAEARVVLAETTQRLDAGIFTTEQEVLAVFTGEHPYNREERVPDDLLALRRADVDAFFAAHYVPAKVVIAVEGDLSAASLAGLLAGAAGDGFAHPKQKRGDVAEWPAGAIPIQWLSPAPATWFRDPENPASALGGGRSLPTAARKAPPVPEPDGKPRVARHSGTWPEVQVAWYLPPADHDNWVHLSEAPVFANDTLEPVFDDDAVVGGGCYAFLGTRGSALLCSAQVEEEEQMESVGRRIAKAFQHELRPPEVSRLVKTDDPDARAWRATVRRDVDSLEELADLSAFRLATGRFDLPSQETSALAGGGGLRGWIALRSAWLGAARAVVTLVEPESRTAMVGDGTSPGFDRGARMVQWPAPALGPVAAERAEERVLENGLRTVVHLLPGAEISAWRLAVPSLPGLEYLEPVVDAAIRTPDTYEGNDIRYRWWVGDALGGTVLGFNQRGGWEPRFPLRALWATVEHHGVGNVQRAFRRKAQREVYAGRSPYTWAARAYRRATREDPERDGLPEIEEAIGTPGAVEAYLAARYQPERATLVLVGGAHTEARTRIVEEMGDWRATPSTPPTLPVVRRRPPEPGVIVLDRNGVGRTVSVTWGCPVTGAPDPLTASLLGVLASDRLFDAVRASSGLTYSPGAWTETRWGGVDLFMNASTELGREAEVLAALRALAGDLGGGRAEPWVDAARREVLSDELLHGSSVLGLAGTLSDGVMRPGSLETMRARRAALADVDASDVAALLGECAAAGIAMVVGPAEEVRRNLEGGDLPVRVLDWRAEHLAFVKRWQPAVQKREEERLERTRRE